MKLAAQQRIIRKEIPMLKMYDHMIISKLKKKEITCSSDLFGLDCAHGGDILAIRCKCYQSCQGRRRSDEEYKHGDLPTTFVAEKPTRSAISTTKLKNTVKT